MNQSIEVKLSADELEGTQATLAQWLVNIGDSIELGQPIAELETDKVSMEVCAPSSGILNHMNVAVGDSVNPEQLIATLIDSKNNPVLTNADDLDMSTKPATEEDINITSTTETIITSGEKEVDASRKSILSPAVRRLLKQHNLSGDEIINLVHGSGKNGRITRDDLLNYLNVADKNKINVLDNQIDKNSFSSKSLNDSLKKDTLNSPDNINSTASQTNLNSQLVPHSNMRKAIANHMVDSLLKTAPHVTSVFEMDMTNIMEHRKWHKKEYTDEHVNLTYTAYFIKAVSNAIKVVPSVNARFHEDALELISDVNIGIGTALGDQGLVVPVISSVQSMKLFDIAKHLTIQTQKARDGLLKPSDLKNGTFTISNHGVTGSLFAAPIIINQPEVAILGIGKLEKRTVVVEENGTDVIKILPKCYVTLTIDHRALDAYQANLFLSTFVSEIEHWGED